MARTYNDPPTTPSQIGYQMNDFFYQKQALIEAKREMYFQPMADVKTMPKHYGKTLKLYHYIPLLDDQNVNDQGIDAAGVAIVDGNLYGSSKDVGTIVGKMPTLTENGGRVNRVGFKRKEVEGSIEKYGFFQDYTEDSVNFDSDSDLMMHINREMIFGANEITEDLLQIDLLNNAGVVKFPGTATAINEVDDTPITYSDLLRMHIDLTHNRTPLHTKVFKGTRMIDTVTLPAARVMYIGHELQPVFEAMTDLHGERAFIPVQKYAGGGVVLNGEIGSVGYFRVVVNPEMMRWEGAGADATGNTTHYSTGGNYDVFPMLVIGSESFSTIGFMTDGKSTKFRIFNKKPGEGIADLQDPFGEKGFMSIKFWYGFVLLRGERLALLYSSGKL